MTGLSLTQLTDKLNNFCRMQLESALQHCQTRQHQCIEIEHWLFHLLQPGSDIEQLLLLCHIKTHALQAALRLRIDQHSTTLAGTPTLSDSVITLLKAACKTVLLEHPHPIRSAHVLLALVSDAHLSQYCIRLFPDWQRLSFDHITHNVIAHLDFTSAEVSAITAPSLQTATTATEENALSRFTVNLNIRARNGDIDPIYGRETALYQMMDVLLRRRQNNPILIGDPGVGKTAIVEGLALKIAQGDVPDRLAHVTLYALDMGLLMAGTGVKGEFEQRITDIIQAMHGLGEQAILFIDEAHMLVGAGNASGSLDAANLLKPTLARGNLRTIAATTWSEYKRHFEQDAALARRFQAVKVTEPDDKTAIGMLTSLRPAMEQHHRVLILDEAIVAAVSLSRKLIAERFLPDKAISLLDTACSQVIMGREAMPRALTEKRNQLNQWQQHDPLSASRKCLAKTQDNTREATIAALTAEIDHLTEQWKATQAQIQELDHTLAAGAMPHTADEAPDSDISFTLTQARLQYDQLQQADILAPFCVNRDVIKQVISEWTGIPVTRMGEDLHDRMNYLRSQLQQRVIGQQHAQQQLLASVEQSLLTINDPNKPLGVFLFTGPSGVGKTHTAHVLAEAVFGSRDHLTLINLSEYKEAHTVSTLIGSPPGYVGYGMGGVLTEAVRRQPYHLIIFDEIEKAHPSIHELFYPLFDQGKLTDSEGREVDFRHTFIIITSNIGSDSLQHDPTVAYYDCTPPELSKQLHNHFHNAFIARLTVVPFYPLTADHAKRIIQLKLSAIKQRLVLHHEQDIEIDESWISALLSQCDYQRYGAREFDKYIQQRILPKITTRLLERSA